MNLNSSWFILGLWILISCKSLTDTTPGCPNNGPGLSSEPLTGESLPRNQISLVFYGGPQGKTGDIVDYLYSNNLQASFFVSASLVAGEEAAMVEMRRKGNLVGTVGFHPPALAQSENPVMDLRQADLAIHPYVTGNIFLLGDSQPAISAPLSSKLNAAGFRKYTGPIRWDLGEGLEGFQSDRQCWSQNIDAITCAGGYFEQIKSRQKGIVAFHSLGGETLELLKELIPAVIANGISMVRLDKVPEIAARIRANGGQVGALAGPYSCKDY